MFCTKFRRHVSANRIQLLKVIRVWDLPYVTGIHWPTSNRTKVPTMVIT